MPEALPDLGALAAALVLVLIAGALWVLAELIQQSFSRLPVVGGWISSNIVGALNDARNTVFGWAGSTWNFAYQLFITIGNWLWRMPYNLLVTINQAANFGNWVAHWLVPNTANTVQGYAYGLYRDAINYGEQVWTDSTGYAYDLWQNATAYAYGLYRDAINYGEQVWNDATAFIQSAFAQATAYAYGLYISGWNYATSIWNDASAAIASAESTAIAHADGLFNAAESDIQNVAAGAAAALSSTAAGIAGSIYTDLDNVASGALAGAWPDAAGDIGALRNVLGGDFPDIQALLPWLAGAGAAGLSGVLFRSLAGTAAITRLADDCIVPNCRNLSQFGQDLQGLIGDIPAAAMLAWFIFLVTDPAGWAADTEAVASGVADTATTAARTLLGV